MEKICIIGDLHTVSAWRLAGVEGVVSGKTRAQTDLEEAVGRVDAGIVIITNELAEDLRARITEINTGSSSPVVIEIPGIDDPHGFVRSAVGYIAEALGIAL